MTTRFTLFFVTLLALSATAAAQDHGRRAPHVNEGPNVVITGRRQLPIQIVLTRGPVDFSPPALQTSFVREIVRSSP